MNAFTHKAFNSSSVIAMGAAISQPGRSHLSVVPSTPVDIEPVAIAIADEPAAAETPIVFLSGNALIERKALTRAVEIALEAVERKNTIPILSNVRMEADAGGITIHGTDLDLEIAIFVQAAADNHFATTLPAHLMKDLLKKAAASDFVSITTTSEDMAKLDFERVDYTLQTLPAHDYPDMEMSAYTNQFEMKGADLWAMLDGTMDAMLSEETRYYLNGIYFHVLDKGNRRTIVCTATDGHRLYSQEFELPFGADDMPGIIIPRKSCNVMRKLMRGKNCPETVTIAVNDSKIRVTFGDVVITSKLVDGTFPDYNRVVPRNNSKPAKLSAKALIEGVESVSLISSERGRAVKLSFDEDHGFCLLTVNNPDTGRAEMSVPCQFTGECMEIGFNASYMIAAVKDASLSGDDVTLMLEDCGSPMLITSDREGWLGVIMPMRV